MQAGGVFRCPSGLSCLEVISLANYNAPYSLHFVPYNFAFYKLHILLLSSSDKYKRTDPQIVQLAKGSVEDARVKGHDFCIKLTSTIGGQQCIFLAFTSQAEYNKWFKKCKKVSKSSTMSTVVHLLKDTL